MHFDFNWPNRRKRMFWWTNTNEDMYFFVVLKLFFDNPDKKYTGSDVCKATCISSGRTYPLLARMHRAGWLENELEKRQNRKLARIFYMLSNNGRKSGSKLFTRDYSPAQTGEIWVDGVPVLG